MYLTPPLTPPISKVLIHYALAVTLRYIQTLHGEKKKTVTHEPSFKYDCLTRLYLLLYLVDRLQEQKAQKALSVSTQHLFVDQIVDELHT